MFLVIGAVRSRIRCAKVQAHAGVISGRETNTIAVLSGNFTVAIVGAVVAFSPTIIVSALVLQSKIQAINQTEEVGVTIGCKVIGTGVHEHVSLGVAIATEVWQHIGPRFNVVYDTVVTTVIKRTKITEF